MIFIKEHLVLLVSAIMFFNVSDSEVVRRIEGGEELKTDKSYVIGVDFYSNWISTTEYWLFEAKTEPKLLTARNDSNRSYYGKVDPGIVSKHDDHSSKNWLRKALLNVRVILPRNPVYLVRAAISPQPYDTWLCGGALVRNDFIVTSAACVDDVEFLYAIAGYRKYVTDDEIDTDPCTQRMKKKVVYTCTPLSYELDYGDLSKWAYIDIALAQVESPYNFKDVTFKQICSYIPTTIPINYEIKYQETGIDAMVFGWGHEKIWRQPEDPQNYNQQYLHYAACLVDDKDECKAKFEGYPEMHQVIEKHMICTIGKGNINEVGDTIQDTDVMADGCTGYEELRGQCKYVKPYIVDETRKNMNTSKRTNSTNKFRNTTKTTLKRNTKHFNKTTHFNASQYGHMADLYSKSKNASRRNGFCQNDHGGPLVAWVGSHEVLIGVASVFKVSSERECTGPYLYTSTQCNGAFLDCVLNGGEGLRLTRRTYNICDTPPPERGYDTVEKYISWKHHPAGPADNEHMVKLPIAQYEKYNYPEGYIKFQDHHINGAPADNKKYLLPESGKNNGAMPPAAIGNVGPAAETHYKASDTMFNSPVINTPALAVGNRPIIVGENGPMILGGNVNTPPLEEHQRYKENGPIVLDSNINPPLLEEHQRYKGNGEIALGGHVNIPPLEEHQMYKENGPIVISSNINPPPIEDHQRYRSRDNYDIGFISKYRGSNTPAKYEPNDYPIHPVYSNTHGLYPTNIDPLQNVYAHKESYQQPLYQIHSEYSHPQSGIHAADLNPLQNVFKYRETYQPNEKHAGRGGDLAPSGIYVYNEGQKYALKDKNPTFEMYAAKYKYGNTKELKKLNQEKVLLRPQLPLHV